MLDKFIELLEQEVKNHSIYVWGGNGEATPTVCEEWIRKKETSATNANRAIKTFNRAVKAGYKDKLRAFDCSGLGYYCLKQSGLKVTDMTADYMKHQCEMISKAEVKRGCFVFKVNSSGKATHIGYVVDDNLNVIEAQGRDEGVVKRALTKGSWNAYGIPSYFKDEIKDSIEPEKEKYVFTRILKNLSPRMKGEDVKELQKLLINEGYSCGNCGADGSFGPDSEKAVKAFQKAHGLTVDGKAGENTITKLGGIWKEQADKQDVFTFTRLLKKKVLLMRGEDVKVLQKVLNDKGHNCGKVDGAFGQKTDSAVRSFQKAKGLTVDGIAGENTVTKLGYKWNG